MAAKLRCPACTSPKIGVYNSRARDYDGVTGIWRRRACKACGHRWTTAEIMNGGDADALLSQRQQLDHAINSLAQSIEFLKILRKLAG